jgi:DNA repair exonuclease SbcCD ATPase subunit
MKIELNGIKISGFMNIAEGQDVILTPGLYGILGKNLDDGGSSNASGKSSFTRAITVGALGTKHVDVNNKEVRNRILDINPIISLSLIVNGVNVDISRTIGGKLAVSAGGEVFEGKADDIQEKLNTLFGISPEHFLHLTHKMQGYSSNFLLMKDSEKKDFLSSFFDTSSVDLISSRNSLQMSAVSTAMTDTSSLSQVLRGKISVLKTDVDSLVQKVVDLSASSNILKMDDIKAQIKDKESLLRDIDEALGSNMELAESMDDECIRLNAELASAESDKSTGSLSLSKDKLLLDIEALSKLLSSAPAVPVELNSELTSVQALISQKNTAAANLIALKKSSADLLTQMDSKKLYMSNIKPDTCHTCNQDVSGEKFAGILANISNDIYTLQVKRADLDSKIAQIETDGVSTADLLSRRDAIIASIAEFKSKNDQSSTRNSIESIRMSIKNIDMEISKKNQEVTYIKASLSRAKANVKMRIDHQRQLLRSEIESLKTTCNMYIRDLDAAKQMLESAQSKYNECLSSLSDLDTKMSDYSRQMAIYVKIAEIVSRNGFIGYIFDNILEEINREVNEYIKQIPVISRLSMYFSPDKTTKSTGNTSKNITSSIFDGDNEVSYETLSGSEKQSLCLIVDAAVDTVLCRRLGVDINYKIFDEQFGWVDSENKEHLLEFIKHKYTDKIILIIDHGSELNAAIDKKIVITKENGLATIECLDT